MRKTLPVLAVVVALAFGASTPAMANTPVVTNADQDFACEAGVTYGTITIVSSDVTIDGCTFDGGGTTAAAIRNGVAGFNNVTIANSTFQGYTGRTIAFGFAEGAALAGDRASNVTIANNTFGNMVGDDATTIAVFNTDGVTISGNTISNADADFDRRRGVNIDGNSAVLVEDNTITMGASGAPFPGVFGAARWGIQVSMSDAPAVDYSIVNNTISGSYDGIVVLSQRDVTGLKIVSNDLSAVFGIRMNAGSATAGNAEITVSGIQVSGNRHDATAFDGFSLGILLQNTKSSTYQDGRITGNRTVDSDGVLSVFGNPTLENVLIRGNR